MQVTTALLVNNSQEGNFINVQQVTIALQVLQLLLLVRVVLTNIKITKNHASAVPQVTIALKDQLTQSFVQLEVSAWQIQKIMNYAHLVPICPTLAHPQVACRVFQDTHALLLEWMLFLYYAVLAITVVLIHTLKLLLLKLKVVDSANRATIVLRVLVWLLNARQAKLALTQVWLILIFQVLTMIVLPATIVSLTLSTRHPHRVLKVVVSAGLVTIANKVLLSLFHVLQVCTEVHHSVHQLVTVHPAPPATSVNIMDQHLTKFATKAGIVRLLVITVRSQEPHGTV